MKVLEEYYAVRKKNNVKDKGLSASIERKAAPFVNGYFTMQNLWLLSKIGCNSLLHIGLFATNERHFDVRVTDG